MRSVPNTRRCSVTRELFRQEVDAVLVGLKRPYDLDHVPGEDSEPGTEYKKGAMSTLAHRAVSARSRPRSRRPERAFDLDNNKICMFLGKDGEHGTEYRKVHIATCSSGCFGKR